MVDLADPADAFQTTEYQLSRTIVRHKAFETRSTCRSEPVKLLRLAAGIDEFQGPELGQLRESADWLMPIRSARSFSESSRRAAAENDQGLLVGHGVQQFGGLAGHRSDFSRLHLAHTIISSYTYYRG